MRRFAIILFLCFAFSGFVLAQDVEDYAAPLPYDAPVDDNPLDYYPLQDLTWRGTWQALELEPPQHGWKTELTDETAIGMWEFDDGPVLEFHYDGGQWEYKRLTLPGGEIVSGAGWDLGGIEIWTFEP